MKKFIYPILIAFSISVLFTSILLLLLTVLAYFFDISDILLSLLMLPTYILPIGVGAYYLAIHCPYKRFFIGILYGLSFFLLVLLISFLLKPHLSGSSSVFPTLLLCTISGAFGGIFSNIFPLQSE